MAAAAQDRPLVYVGFAADLVHHGHLNIIREAEKLNGWVMVGLLTDEAIVTYKRQTICNWEDRAVVVRALKGVDEVVRQETHDYSPNLIKYKPAYVVHGSDWRTGTQAKVRQKVIDLLATWGGKLVEPEYTPEVSTTDIIQLCYDAEKRRRDSKIAPVVPDIDHDEKHFEELRKLADKLSSARPLAYVGVSTDFLHHGHVRIIQEAQKYGRVVVGLLSDAAVHALGKKPIVSFENRRVIFEGIKGVDHVVVQHSLDYTASIEIIKPEFVVHGDDWKQGSQARVRSNVVDALNHYGGKLIEPATTRFSEAAESIAEVCYNRIVEKNAAAAAAASAVDTSAAAAVAPAAGH